MENDHTSRIGNWVIYKTNQFIAFNKPPGIPVQSDKTEDISLLKLAEIYSKTKLFLVHRLDRPASGIVVFAKNKNAAAHLSSQFKQREVKKTYLAVVGKRPEKTEDTVIHYLKKDGRINKSTAGDEASDEALRSELKYRVLSSIDNYHLLEVEMLTGRHHQIRAQLSAIGCPIKGDVKYGFRRGNKDRSIHLHGWNLSFSHPVTGEKVFLKTEPPSDTVWNALMDRSSTE